MRNCCNAVRTNNGSRFLGFAVAIFFYVRYSRIITIISANRNLSGMVPTATALCIGPYYIHAFGCYMYVYVSCVTRSRLITVFHY